MSLFMSANRFCLYFIYIIITIYNLLFLYALVLKYITFYIHIYIIISIYNLLFLCALVFEIYYLLLA